MKQNITMQDIADRFGVSKVTVSKALNNKDGVSEELKGKIIAVAEEMGYRMNTIAKSLTSNTTFNVGVIIPERFTNTGSFHRESDSASFYMDFYQVVSKALEQEKYSAILSILSASDEEAGRMPRLYTDNKVDGFIILGQVNHSYVEKLNETKLPIVFLDFYDEYLNMDSITSDNFTGSYMITNYLLKLGFKKLAFVGNIYSTSSIQDRYLGYYKSLLEHGIALDVKYIISDRNEDGAYIDIDYPEVMPEAFVCNCDQVANYVIRDLQAKGYRVPEDISVVGFDNSIFSALSNPPITTVEVDTDAMAKAGVNIILRKLVDKTYRSGKISIRGKIVYKESVKNPSQD